MRMLRRLLIAVLVPIAVTIAAMLATMAIDGRATNDSADAYQMARFFLREYIRNELSADPNQFAIIGGAAKSGPSSWTASGHYRAPVGPQISWEMQVYGPFDGDKWRNCGLTIDGATATRVGNLVRCQ